MKRIAAVALILAAFSGTAAMLASGIGCNAMPCCQRAGVELVAPDPGCCDEAPSMCAAPPRAERAMHVAFVTPAVAALEVTSDVVAEQRQHSEARVTPAAPTRIRLAHLSTLLI